VLNSNRKDIFKIFALRLIRVYQKTWSRVSPPACRFTPTCSQYSYEAIEKYGLGKGVFLTMGRLARCNPFHTGGYDPVP